MFMFHAFLFLPNPNFITNRLDGNRGKKEEMENTLDKKKLCGKISSLIKENKSYFVWPGTTFDEVESLSVILPKYHGKDKYQFCGEMRIIRNMENDGYTSHPAKINGIIYLEEGKEVELTDIEKSMNIQEL